MTMGLILREGLDTDEQRAWFFWHLKDEGGYEGQGGGQAAAPQHFDKPMEEADLEKWNKKQWSQSNFSAAEKKSVFDYSRQDFEDINHKMRVGPLAEKYGIAGTDEGEVLDRMYEAEIRNISSAIEKSSTDRDLSVYRGFDMAHYGDLKVGSTLEDKGFVSTSTERKTAVKFFKDGPGGDGRPRVFQLDLPKGYHALPLDGESDEPVEREVLLGPGRFRVSNVEDDGFGLVRYHLSPIK